MCSALTVSAVTSWKNRLIISSSLDIAGVALWKGHEPTEKSFLR